MLRKGKKLRKVRIDELVAGRGLAKSLEAARALIMSGAVTVDGVIVDKAGHGVDPGGEITLKERRPYVSRGGVKLAGLLDAFKIDVTGLTALDVGSSTGGFTDCLLKRGAARVHAVDVGRGIIDWKLREDGRVHLIEGRNIRLLKPEEVGRPVDIAVVDVSFISLEKVLPVLRVKGFLKEGAGVAALVKPQFEVGRTEVGRGGIVRDAAKQRGAVDRVVESSLTVGYTYIATLESPIKGAKGNREFWIWLKA